MCRTDGTLQIAVYTTVRMESEEKEDRIKDGLITFVMTVWASEYKKLLL